MPDSYDTIVVGAGIFGSVIARGLRSIGQQVLVIDDTRPNSGSRPAACLMKPSWFSSMGKDAYDPSLKLLDQLYGLQDIRFRVPAGHVSVHWCDPAQILRVPEITASITKVTTFDGGCAVYTNTRYWKARTVVVAAGIWTKLLFPEIDVVAQSGLALLWRNQKIDEPFVRVWAPYKQLVAFNRGDGLWVGDGTAVRRFTQQHYNASLTRCHQAAGMPVESEVDKLPVELFGHRPYIAGAKPCLLQEVRPNIWVATGGAKNGTIAAGWCAQQLIEKLQ